MSQFNDDDLLGLGVEPENGEAKHSRLQEDSGEDSESESSSSESGSGDDTECKHGRGNRLVYPQELYQTRRGPKTLEDVIRSMKTKTQTREEGQNVPPGSAAAVAISSSAKESGKPVPVDQTGVDKLNSVDSDSDSDGGSKKKKKKKDKKKKKKSKNKKKKRDESSDEDDEEEEEEEEEEFLFKPEVNFNPADRKLEVVRQPGKILNTTDWANFYNAFVHHWESLKKSPIKYSVDVNPPYTLDRTLSDFIDKYQIRAGGDGDEAARYSEVFQNYNPFAWSIFGDADNRALHEENGDSKGAHVLQRIKEAHDVFEGLKLTSSDVLLLAILGWLDVAEVQQEVMKHLDMTYAARVIQLCFSMRVRMWYTQNGEVLYNPIGPSTWPMERRRDYQAKVYLFLMNSFVGPNDPKASPDTRGFKMDANELLTFLSVQPLDTLGSPEIDAVMTPFVLTRAQRARFSDMVNVWAKYDPNQPDSVSRDRPQFMLTLLEKAKNYMPLAQIIVSVAGAKLVQEKDGSSRYKTNIKRKHYFLPPSTFSNVLTTAPNFNTNSKHRK